MIKCGAMRVSALQETVKQVLEAENIENAWREASWIIKEVCGEMPDVKSEVGEQEQERVLATANCRAKGEPLQYVLGWVDFLGLRLKCDQRALIPRPETEQLAEILLERFPCQERVLDLGTGTGALALSLAKAWKECVCVGVDQSSESLSLARENGERCGLSSQVKWVLSDWFAQLGNGCFSMIVANPPYVSEEAYACVDASVKNFEPKGALVADEEGLGDVRRILSRACQHLTKNGVLAMELGWDQGQTAKKLALTHGFAKAELVNDRNGKERFLICYFSDPKPIEPKVSRSL